MPVYPKELGRGKEKTTTGCAPYAYIKPKIAQFRELELGSLLNFRCPEHTKRTGYPPFTRVLCTGHPQGCVSVSVWMGRVVWQIFLGAEVLGGIHHLYGAQATQ